MPAPTAHEVAMLVSTAGLAVVLVVALEQVFDECTQPLDTVRRHWRRLVAITFTFARPLIIQKRAKCDVFGSSLDGRTRKEVPTRNLFVTSHSFISGDSLLRLLLA